MCHLQGHIQVAALEKEELLDLVEVGSWQTMLEGPPAHKKSKTLLFVNLKILQQIGTNTI
jgi:hypothetical protein